MYLFIHFFNLFLTHRFRVILDQMAHLESRGVQVRKDPPERWDSPDHPGYQGSLAPQEWLVQPVQVAKED